MKIDSSLKSDVMGGIVTFFTMSYIVLVNPSILSTEGTGFPFSGVMTATVLLCFSMTLLMGLYAKIPFAVAPGMGINAYLTYTVVLGKGISWQTALGLTFWAGVLFVLVSATPLREKIAQSIPNHLRVGAAVGIGLFLCFIGLKNAGIVIKHPATFVGIGKLGHESSLALFGIVLIAFLLRYFKAIAFISSILIVTIISLLFGFVKFPDSVLSMPDFSSAFLQLNIVDALKLSTLPILLSILFTDLFDSMATFVGVSTATGMLDGKGQPKNLRQGLLVDAFATMSAGLFGTSAGTAYIESAAGIEAGARTGRASMVTALCFLPCFFIAPLAAIIPAYATAPVLIVVGALMFKSISELKVEKIEDLLPTFLTLILIPLTFSITQGLLWGFISHVVLYFMYGRMKEVSTTMRVLALISLVLICVESL